MAALIGATARNARYGMPHSLVFAALKKLPDWMYNVNERFDKRVGWHG